MDAKLIEKTRPYDEEFYKSEIYKLKMLLIDLCDQVNDDINPANRTKHLKRALQDSLDYFEGEK